MHMDVRENADHVEIRDLLTRYASAIDHDIELWDEVFAEDAQIDYTAAGGAQGSRAHVKEFMIEIHKTALATQHLVSNVVVELDGDRATGRSAVRAMLIRPGTRAHLVEITDLIGFYDDEFSKRPEGWRIVNRRTTLTWREYRVAAKNTDPGIA